MARIYPLKEKNIPNRPVSFGVSQSALHVRWAVLALISSALAQLLGTSVAYVFRGVIDSATRFSVGEMTLATVVLWVVLYPAFVIGEQLLWRGSGFAGMRWLTGFNATGHVALFTYLSSHSHTYFADRFAGALANKIGNAIDGVERILESFLWNYLPTVLSFIVSIIFAYLASPILAGVFLFWILIAIPVNVYFARRVSTLSFQKSKQQSKLRGIVVDIFSNIAAVQHYARRHDERMLVQRETEVLRKAELKSWTATELQLLMNNIIFVGGFVVSVVIVSFLLWQNSSITLGEFLMALTLMNGLIGSLTFIGMSMKNFAQQYGNAKEGLQEILLPHGITNFPKAKELSISQGEIALENVGFSYGTRTVFNNLTLTVKGGERLGIVGSSGAGKTTLVSLLLRQQDVHEGLITIDGQNIRKVTLDSLRRAVATVPQEPLLFHRTLRENIAYGAPGATDEEVFEAARRAQAHEFIVEFPDGYDTLVGERGVKLSGGQRQRVAIARAILKSAPVLVLDEATSSLDSESEAAIQTALHTLMENKTVIAIAHRLSTIKEMDRIIVLDGGRIVQDGSHDELLKEASGIYAKLWNRQAGGFLQDE